MTDCVQIGKNLRMGFFLRIYPQNFLKLCIFAVIFLIMIQRIDYVNKILAFKDTQFIKILTGIRRSGKSTIMKMIEKSFLDSGVEESAILSFRFDSLDYEDLTAKELFQNLKEKILQNSQRNLRTYIFLDEVQEIEGWEKVVNSLMSDFNVDIYVTGSNSKMMSSEISTYLSGRYISFKIFPLSFSEYKIFRKEMKSEICDFLHYVRFGGFPAIHIHDFEEDEAYSIVKDIYNSVVFSDVVKRMRIKKTDMFQRVVRYIIQNVGNTFSANSISKYFKSESRTIDNETVYEYIKALENAYVIHRCSRFDIKGKEILKTQEKFYLADSSLLFALLGFNSNFVPSMLENIVYLELLRRGYEVYVGKFDDFEIDFVASRRNEKIYIQIADRISSKETELREYENLMKIQDNFPKYVLLNSDFAAGNYEGIRTMKISDWLLEFSSASLC